MPYIHGEHNGRAAIIDIAIIDATRHRDHKQSRNPVLSGVRPFKALIDTGATSTMISKRLISELRLEQATVLPYRNKDGEYGYPLIYSMSHFMVQLIRCREIQKKTDNL